MKGIVNAKIQSTTLGYEDHGIMTYLLLLDYGDSCQGFGGYQIDNPTGKDFKRKPTLAAGYSIARILEVVGVDKWEKLPGHYVRADVDGLIKGIGNVLKDEWFYPEKEYKEQNF